MAIGDETKGTIASEVTTPESDLDGTRHSRDSEWTTINVPSNSAINVNKTVPHVLGERGSEHSYELVYDNYVEIVPGTSLQMPQTIRLKTHARSSKGPKGGGGAMKLSVDFYYVQFR